MTFSFIVPITANTISEIKSKVVRVEGNGERNVSNYLARNWIIVHSWDGPNPKPQIWTSSDLGKTKKSVCELCGLAPLLDPAYLMSHKCKKVQKNHYMPFNVLKENKWISSTKK